MIKLHIDSDIGGDIDDLCALAMALNWPNVDLLAVTTVADDGGRRAGYARYAVQLAGRADIPVAAGADVALDCYRQRPGLPDERLYWPEPIPPAPTPCEHALDLLERSINQDAVIAAIGPFTNLALLEKRSPGILRRARLYLMGGYVFPPRAGFPAWDHTMDWNVQVDAPSALHVIQNSNPTLVCLPVTAETWLRQAYLPALRQSSPLAQIIARQADAFAHEENFAAKYGRTCAGVPSDIINFQYDPLACAIALGWRDRVEIRDVRIQTEIRDGWLCQTLDDRGVAARVVTGVDGDAFSQIWLSIVTRRYSLLPYSLVKR